MSTPQDADIARLLELFQTGQLGQAFQLAAQILQRDQSCVEAWRVLGQIRLFQGLHAEARQCAAKAAEHAPDDPEILLLQGSIDAAAGAMDDALALAARVLEARPQDVEALTLKAGCLERIGRAEEALEIVRAAPDPRPAALEAVAVRALLRLGRTEDALASADSALDRDDVPPRRRYHLVMLRAKALDRLGRHEEAFDAVIKGNAAVVPEKPEVEPYARRGQTARKTYTPEALRRFPKNAVSRARHVFIAGFPRTGTTLVEQILDAHPGMTGVGEAKEIDVATRRLQQMTGAFVPYPACAEFADPAQLAEIAGAYEQAQRDRGLTGDRFVDKNLQNLLHVGFIAQIFPEARFVLTRRDVRDVAVSCLFGQFRAEAMPHLMSLDELAPALEESLRLIEHWREALPDRTTVVDYESLVRNHDAEVRRLVDFAGLPWDDRCLRFFETGRTVMTLSYDQVDKPIYDSSIGRWRHYESRLGPVLELAEARDAPAD